MRHFALFLVLFFCFHLDARSETVHIGSTSVSYSLPAGFALADGLFPIDLKALDKEFSMDTVVFATFVPEADLKMRQADPRAVPSWYVHLAYDAIFSKLSIGSAGFASVTWLVKRVIAKQYANAGFLKKLEDVIAGALNRKMIIHSMAQKGFVENKPGYCSMLAYGYGELEGKTGMESVTLATMTTFFMVKGKLITIIQACRIQSEEDLPVFSEKALRIAAEITGHQETVGIPSQSSPRGAVIVRE